MSRQRRYVNFKLSFTLRCETDFKITLEMIKRFTYYVKSNWRQDVQLESWIRKLAIRKCVVELYPCGWDLFVSSTYHRAYWYRTSVSASDEFLNCCNNEIAPRPATRTMAVYKTGISTVRLTHEQCTCMSWLELYQCYFDTLKFFLFPFVLDLSCPYLRSWQECWMNQLR